MNYRFKSQGTGDVIMMVARGQEVLRVMGMEPATEGRIDASSLPAALSAIEQAIAQQDTPLPEGHARSGAGEAADTSWVTLRQRTGMLVAMMQRARAGNHEVAWQSVPRPMHAALGRSAPS